MTVPHFGFPFRLAGSSFAVVDQDTSTEIVQSVQILLRTRRGQRVELPDYGIDDPVFTGSIDTQDVITAVADWEPRARVDVTTDIDTVDELIQHVCVQVTGGEE